MITVQLGAGTLARTRWSLSPVADLLGLLRDQKRAAHPGPLHSGNHHLGQHHSGSQGGGRRTAAGPSLLADPLAALVAELTAPEGGYQPDFLTPKPVVEQPLPRVFGHQLDQIAGTDPDVVERQVVDRYAGRAVPETLRHHLRNGRLAPLLAQGLSRSWQQGGESAWRLALPRLRADLDERARQVGRLGLIAALSALAPEITTDGLRLGIALDPWAEELLLEEDELVCVPRAFGLDRPSPQLCQGGDAVLYYPAGLQVRPAARAQAELIGATRHLVLAAVAKPSSTKALSARLGFATATISYHLDVLYRNGLVSRRRKGLEVLYRQTARGRDLVA